jgi:hypothetical protein
VFAFDINDLISDTAKDLGVSETFCLVIIGILVLTIIFVIIAWLAGGRRLRKERRAKNKKICPVCGGENPPDALLCTFCDEML